MSQRRQKKQLSIMENVDTLTDQELRAALRTYDISPGPITDSTRSLYRNKLASLIALEDGETSSPGAQGSPPKSAAAGVIEEEDEDTSDEDYIVGEEEEDEEDENEDDEESEGEEENLLSELQDDDITRGNITSLSDLTSGAMGDPVASANRISRVVLISLIVFFVAIFSFYLLSSNNLRILEPLKQFKNVTKQMLILLALSPLGIFIYKSFCFYRHRRTQENKRVCELVSEALELLQSPDNPRGLMPILHIRDTLLTPAERKNKKTIMVWTKAVKFIEDHESRVKVELTNIDGEDFRAWKWIGSRKV